MLEIRQSNHSLSLKSLSLSHSLPPELESQKVGRVVKELLHWIHLSSLVLFQDDILSSKSCGLIYLFLRVFLFVDYGTSISLCF